MDNVLPAHFLPVWMPSMHPSPIKPTGTCPAREPISVLQPDHLYWPRLWREMNDPPPEIQLTGCADALNTPMIGIVGTRRATPRGLAVARGLAADLAAVGWTIVSGLARGIDGAAHQGALDVGGRSVGIMATGCDLTYPAAHRGLRQRLEENGCCLTEFPAGVGPRKYHFPRRNRLIAGLVAGLIVVEAPIKSGAMVTAYLALDYNRDVFAVPGPVDLATSWGCHRLLREGAHLMERLGDLTHILGLPSPAEIADSDRNAPSAAVHDPVPGSPAQWIHARLDLEGKSRDELRSRWPGNEDKWQEGLLALELAGLIRRLPGGRLARTIWRS
jgi:DNA processing protein